LRVLTDFTVGQGIVQGIGIFIGIFLVRTLNVSEYAKFGLAFGFQTTATVLMDLGYASTIIPLVGERISDRVLIGRYVRAAKAHRDRTYWAISPFVAIAFLFITYRQHWSWVQQLALLATILFSLYFSGPLSYFAAPLVLQRRLRALYLPRTISSLTRLLVYTIAKGFGFLNALTAAGASALNIALDGSWIKRNSKQSIEWPEKDDPIVEREVQNYIFPALPAILLGAFHGQITVFLMGVFGTTTSIAEVAALSRLGQLFNVLMTFNFVLVEPFMARLPKARIRNAYILLICLALVAGALLTLISFVFPELFLWPLGRQYKHLRGLIGWVIMTACISFVAGLIWVMNRSRKWVFWRGAIAEVGLLIAVQATYLIVVGVRTTREAVFFNLASSFCYLVAHLYVGIYGFRKGPRPTPSALETEIGIP
jgi:O-antigen/teichoic acid export membrane protein